MKHVTEPLTPPRRLDPTIPEAVDALVVKLLAKDPADRPASATELLDDIEGVRRGAPPPAPTPRTGTPRIGARKTAAPTDQTTAATAGAATTAADTATTAPVAGGQRTRFASRPVRRRRATVVILCGLLALALLGLATLGLSRGPEDGTPLGRVQGVTGEGLDAPAAEAGGTGGAGGGEAFEPPPAGPQASPPPASPPAASPPPSAPPEDPSPGGNQYDGG
jgi:serine/threonine-protein kinase